MALKVEHRPDDLIQNVAQIECSGDMKDINIGRVTIPTIRVLDRFLGRQVIDRIFMELPDLVRTLDCWPDFAVKPIEEGGGGLSELHRDFSTLRILEDGQGIACGESPGGPFIVALIKDI